VQPEKELETKMTAEEPDYIVGNGLVTFIAVLMTFLSALAIHSILDTGLSGKGVEYSILAFTIFIWVFRFKRSWFWWLPRLIAIGSFIGISVLVYNEWKDSFLVFENSKCKSANELSPLFIHLTFGAFALNYSLSGAKLFEHSFILKRRLTVFNGIWYLLFLPGVVLSLWTFSNTFDAGLLMGAAEGLVKTLLVCVMILAGIAAVIYMFSLPEKRRMAAAKSDYEKATKQSIDSILEAYKSFVLSGPYCRLYGVIDDQPLSKRDDIIRSKVGGAPYAELGDQWPIGEDAECPPIFCMQLALNDSELSADWLDRLIVVFVVDWTVVVRSYSSPDADNAIDISNGSDLFGERFLYPMKVPIDKNLEVDEDGWSDFDEGFTSRYALEHSQSLKQSVMELSEQPEEFLDLVLDAAGYPTYQPIDTIRQAKTPNLIQNPHEAICDICSQPLRFLFEFGEILEGEFTFGDAGMVYIYGCDEHPSCCKGFVDSH